ncbi:MAG TPA: aldo/keto reductase [Vicinamibacterales bacterium]|nr:aldo/keto reductase [Vicinamibacterales bacterium]
MSDSTLTRRDFVKVGAAGAAGAAIALGGVTLGAAPPMPERPLGRTGYKVRLFSLGGQATLEKAGTRDESVAIINRAIDLGVNYIDTAASYGRPRDEGKQRWELNGVSQTHIGEVMATRRKEIFLASKTDDRTRDGSLRLLEQSLRLLKTDHLDLWQLHNVMRQEQLDQIFGKDGAIEALQRARDQKMVRFLGITGHYDPQVLMNGLARFDFDTILMALNPADKHHLPFVNTVLAMANSKNIGVIGMKIPARRRLFKEGGITTIGGPLTYVLSLPVSTVIIGVDDVKQLEENVAIAKAFTPMPAGEMARLEGLTATYVSEASWFKKDAAGWQRPGDDDQNTD